MRISISIIVALICSAPLTVGAQAPLSPAPEPYEAPEAPQEDDTPTAQAAAVLSQFSHEPTVLEVQEAASRYALVHPDTYANWLSRAAWSNLLPERLTGELQHTADDDTNVRTATVTGSQTETLDRDAQVRLKVFAEWDLSQLIFDQDEYNAAKELSKIVTRREDLLTTINKLYFARRQVQALALMSPAKTPAKALKQQIQLAGLTADLDALTGGWFSTEVAAGLQSSRAHGAAAATRPVAPSAARR
jgi:hypothetical protein